MEIFTLQVLQEDSNIKIFKMLGIDLSLYYMVSLG